MEISIQSDTNNPMLQRREISFVALQDSSTPPREEVKKEICKKLNLDPELTVLVAVRQEFGLKRSSGKVHTYKTKQQLEASEPKYLMARFAKKAAKKEAAATQEAPPQEKGEKAEEKKEKPEKPKKAEKEEDAEKKE